MYESTLKKIVQNSVAKDSERQRPREWSRSAAYRGFNWRGGREKEAKLSL